MPTVLSRKPGGSGGGGGSPSGPAGGDLTGTYPNPSIANGAVTEAMMDSGAATVGQVLTADGAGGASYEDASAGGSTQVPVNVSTPRVSTLAGNSFWTAVGLTDWDAGHWEFVKDVDGKAYGSVSVPNNYVSGGVIRLAIAANATSGVTRLQIGSAAVAAGESLDPASLTDEAAQDITVPGTAYLRKDVTFTLTPTLAAGDMLILEVFHNGAHANDTLAVNTLLFGVWLEYS